MPTYTIFILNNAYTVQTVLQNTNADADWLKMNYRIALNDVDSCSIWLPPARAKVAFALAMNRLLVYRNGVLQFGGIILRESWNAGIAAEDEVYQIDALGGAIYLDWRLILPAAGSAYDELTNQADDLAKAYVRSNAGSAATVAARRHSDLTIAADAGACSSWTEQPRYDNLLEECQKLAKLGGFDFRCVPSATGFVFTTAFPQWGLDRTFANGTNADAVFSLDRRNFERIRYVKDTLGHYNYVYVAGQGEGADQVINERSTAGDITLYKRRERFESATSCEDSAAVDYVGDMRLKEMRAEVGMTVLPLPTTWKAPWDIGDLVTIVANRYGRSYTSDAKVTAIDVTVDADGIEQVVPEMEAI